VISEGSRLNHAVIMESIKVGMSGIGEWDSKESVGIFGVSVASSPKFSLMI